MGSQASCGSSFTKLRAFLIGLPKGVKNLGVKFLEYHPGVRAPLALGVCACEAGADTMYGEGMDIGAGAFNLGVLGADTPGVEAVDEPFGVASVLKLISESPS